MLLSPEPGVEASFDLLLKQARLDGPSSDAAGMLFSRYAAELSHLIQSQFPRSLGAKGGPSDIVQDAGYDFIQGFSTFNGSTEAEFRQWLRRLAIHRLFAFGRYFKAQGRDVAKERPFQTGEDSAVYAHVPVYSGDSPSGEAAGNEDADRIRRAIAELSPDDQELIFLDHFTPLNSSEICMLLSLSAEALRTRRSRAVLRLRRILETLPERGASND